MKLSYFAKKLMKASDCEIIIRCNGVQIKQPQSPAEFESKIDREILEDFTVLSFTVAGNQLTFNVK